MKPGQLRREKGRRKEDTLPHGRTPAEPKKTVTRSEYKPHHIKKEKKKGKKKTKKETNKNTKTERMVVAKNDQDTLQEYNVYQ